MINSWIKTSLIAYLLVCLLIPFKGSSQSSSFSVSAQATSVELDSAGEANLNINDLTISVVGSASVTMSLSNTSFSCNDLGLKKEVLTAVDENGNTAYDTVYVTVVDNIAPWVTASDVTLYLDSSGTASFDTAALYQAFNDNCNVSFNFTPQVFNSGDRS